MFNMKKIDRLQIWELKLLVIINNNLYKKQIIDGNLYSKVNDKLLLMIKNGETKND